MGNIDTVGFAGEPVQFAGSSSYLPEITPSEFHWFVNENKVSDKVNMTYVFDRSGEYEIKLVIKGMDSKNEEEKEYCSSVILVIIERKENN
jgi:PKD repeat protein